MPRRSRPPRQERRTLPLTLLALGALTLVAAAVVWGYLHWAQGVDEVEREAADDVTAPAAPGRTATPAEAPTLLVVGDSFEAGSGPGWAEVLADEHGWIGYIIDVPAYLTTTNQQARIEGKIVAAGDEYEPDLVIVAGGRADTGSEPGRVAEAAAQSVGAAHEAFPDSDVALVSPFSSGTPDDGLRELAAVIGAATADLEVSYVEVTTALPNALVSGDNVHPSVDGQRHLAEVIGEQLESDGVMYDARN